MPPHPANFVFLVDTGFLHVDQADLELLTLGDWPSLAFQSAGITDMSYCAWPIFVVLSLPKCLDYRYEPPFPDREKQILIESRPTVYLTGTLQSCQDPQKEKV